MLSELIPDEMPHYSSRDDQAIRVICMNTLWHLYSDLITSIRNFVPNSSELLASPYSIVLDCIETVSNRPLILKLREEFQRANDNPECDRFMSLIFSKLPVWKLMSMSLEIKRRAAPGIMAQRILIKLFETISELSWHSRVCIVPNRRFSVNAVGTEYFTFRSQIWEKRETITRNRGMRNFTLERYSSTLCPQGNIYLLLGINGHLEYPHFMEMPLYGETSISQQGVEFLSSFTTECKWMTNIVDPIIFDASNSPIDVLIKPILVKIQDGYVLTFARMNTNVKWAPDALATKTEPGNIIKLK